ncbi:hypothetical protein ACP70R_033143 [Stipagrostis hirtigluma subsp. patula]
MGMHAIPDELLELILLRLGSPVFLLRAASACKRWRRIVAGAGFLGRFRSLNGPAAVAVGVFRQTRPPSFVRSSTLNDRHFSLDFLPGGDATRPWPWRIMDSRGSLLLLDCLDPNGGQAMVVCEPATRRYRRIAPISSFREHVVRDVFLLDGDGREAGGGIIRVSNFKVLCVLYRCDRTSGRCYHHAGVLTPGKSRRKIEIKEAEDVIFLGATSSSVYWHVGGGTMLALDRSRVELSSFALPNAEDFDDDRIFPILHLTLIASRRDGEARIIVSKGGGNLKVFARINGSGEWALEKNIQLSVVAQGLKGYYPWYFDKPARISCIEATPTIKVTPWESFGSWQFYLDVDTGKAELGSSSGVDTTYPCELPWPPVMRACTEFPLNV